MAPWPTSLFIRHILDMQPIARRFLLFLKYWKARINMKFHHGVIVLMGIFYLQKQKVLPSVSKFRDYENYTDQVYHLGWDVNYKKYSAQDIDLNKAPDSRRQFKFLARDFFEFYSKRFNYNEDIVCPYLGYEINKSALRNGGEGLFNIMDSYKQFCRQNTNWIDLNKPLVVQDLFELNRNVAAHIDNADFNKIIDLFKISAYNLRMKAKVCTF